MWTLILFLLLPTTMAAHRTIRQFYGDFYEGDQVLRVVPDTESKVGKVLGIRKVRGLNRLDPWMPTFRPNYPADFYAKKAEVAIIKEYLKNQSIPYSVLIENVTEAIIAQRTKRRRRYSKKKYDYKQFHPLNEIYEELDKLGKNYSDISRVFSLGSSYENREMKAIQIKSRIKPGKKIFFIECGTHAREWLSPATCMWLIKSLLEERHSEHKHGKKKEKTCHRIDWVIVPVLNVDGYAYSWTKEGRFWRKNRKPNNGSTCNGTDLNRNWGYAWGGNDTTNDPCTPYYRGSGPFSEKETRNVAKYLYRNRCHLLGYIGLHSYSQFWMTPWGYKSERPEHYLEMKRVSDIAVNAINNSGEGAVYEEPGPSSKIIYPNNGSAKDWTYGILNVQYSFGVELRPHYNGSHGFLIPPDQIKYSGEEILAAVKAISTEVHLYRGRKQLNSRKAHEH